MSLWDMGFKEFVKVYEMFQVCTMGPKSRDFSGPKIDFTVHRMIDMTDWELEYWTQQVRYFAHI